MTFLPGMRLVVNKFQSYQYLPLIENTATGTQSTGRGNNITKT